MLEMKNDKWTNLIKIKGFLEFIMSVFLFQKVELTIWK